LVKGNEVHLTGYLEPSDDDESITDESEEDEAEEEEETVSKLLQAKVP
jgi:hypothetical protein